MIKPSAIIFDIDDTLVDTTMSYRDSIIKTVESYGLTCSAEDISDIKMKGNANNDWQVSLDILSQKGIDATLEEVTEKFESIYQGTEQLAGLKQKEKLLVNIELLHELSQNFILGIVTGRPRKDAEEFLKINNIKNLFGAVVTMDDGPLKPDGFPVEKAMTILGVNDACMIGDTPDDIISAINAGAIPIGVIGPGDDPELARQAFIASGAQYILNSINDIIEILD
ncbi:MAG: HAD-IA family hydrolase [Deltaproteobacteria bacterium]|nr:HAD-IA family hydrolase [Deltaproteobacteria bacterium]